MIKIAYILTPIDFGGAEKVNLTFLRNIDRNRFDIHPIFLVRPWEKDNYFISQIESANYSNCTIPVAIKPPNEGRDYFRITRSIWYLYLILSKGSFDLVHTHGYFADIIAMPVCKFLGIHHIATCHGFISNDRKLDIYMKLDKLMLRFVDNIIAVSTEIKNILVRSGIDESHINVIQNAVPNLYQIDSIAECRTEKRKKYSIGEEETLIGYVGRLSKEKGVRYLIEAASLLKRKVKTFKLIIIGEGPEKKELEYLTRSKGLEQYIIFAGFQRDIEKWLPALDLFILPSLTEGTPMALLEAMSMGIPVIATSVGGVPMIVKSGVNGLLVAPADSKELGLNILTLINNPDLRCKVATNGIRTIKERFDIKEWCDKIERQYDELLQKRP